MNQPSTLPLTATAFSWELYIGGVPFEHFGDISISQSVSGYGISGVITSTMSVTTNNRTYGGTIISGNDLPINAEVVLTCSNDSINPPVFYVTSRKVDGNITEWTCCDIMSKAEKQLTFYDSDFTDDKISIYDAMEKVKTQCGFESIAYSFSASSLSLSDTKLDKSSCEDSTARNILETVSNILCGYWIGNGSGIKLVNFGTSSFSGYVFDYSEISFGGKRTFSKVLCTDGDDIYTAGSGNDANTLLCSSAYASQDIANAILNTMLDSGQKIAYTYQAWSCAKGKTEYWLYLGDIAFVGNDNVTRNDFICNSVTLYPSPSGLFFTASRNNVSEDESDYMSEVRRQLERKVELDKINNNVALRRDGIYFFENGYKTMSASEQKDAKYGFTVDKGVTEYDGAMVSKVTPSSAEINDDGTEATINYEGKSYKYTIDYDDNGNITGFAKEAKEGT